MSETVRTAIEFVTGSEGRRQILEGLQQDSLNQDDLHDQVSLSKKTTKRHLDELIGRDWIEQRDNQYELTSVGNLIYRECRCTSGSHSEQANESETANEKDLKEGIRLIAGSKGREQVFRALGDQPARQSELDQRLSASRSTIHRCIRDFEKQGWIRKKASSGQYEITTAGEELANTYDELTDSISVIQEAEPFLSSLVDDRLEFPIDVLEAGMVSVSSRDEPHTAVTDFLRNLRFEDTTHFRSMAPVVSQVYNKEIEDYVGSNVKLELIIDESVLTTSKSKNPGGLETAIETENIELYLHPGPVSFGLGIFNDEMAMLGAFDEDGNHRAGLIGNDEIVVDWMMEVYETYKKEAEHLTDIPDE